MEPEEIETALEGLTNPTTAPVLAGALGYRNYTSVTHACHRGGIPGAVKVGNIWLIPLAGVRQALKEETLRPRWKQKPPTVTV